MRNKGRGQADMTAMPTTTGPRLVMSPKGRAAKLDGAPVVRVTDVLNALSKPGLVQWAADCAADYAVDHWHELDGLSTTKRLAAIRYAHREAVDRAKVDGTTVHGFGERLVRGEPVTPPDALRGMVESYARFLDDWQIEPVAIETPVAWSGPAPYAGRTDLHATIGVRDGASALVDLKTGKAVYAETALQLAAYAHADLWQPNGPESETTKPRPDLVYVAHVRADRVDMIPVPAALDPNQWRVFRYAQQLSTWIRAHAGLNAPDPLIGEPEAA